MANIAQVNQRLNQDISNLIRALETVLTCIGNLKTTLNANTNTNNNRRHNNEDNESYC